MLLSVRPLIEKVEAATNTTSVRPTRSHQQHGVLVDDVDEVVEVANCGCATAKNAISATSIVPTPR